MQRLGSSIVLLAFVVQALKAPRSISKGPDRALNLTSYLEFDILDKLEAGTEAENAIVHPDLMPSDLKVLPGDQLATGAMLFSGGCTLAAVGIAIIYWENGLTAVVAIIAYTMTLSCMSLSIRNVFVQNHFAFPRFVTACDALGTLIATSIVLKVREVTTGQKIVVPTINSWIFGVGPVALCGAFSLGLSNLSLLLTSAHFYEILSASNVVMCAIIGELFGNKLNKRQLAPVIFITLMLPILALGEVTFSVPGFVLMMLGGLLRGLKAQLQCSLMAPGASTQTFDPLNLVCWISLLTFVVTMAWSLVTEGLSPWKHFWNPGVISSVGITCIFAIILNTSSMFVMKEVGPVGAMIIGELKGVLACVGAVFAYGEVMSMQQLIAYPLVIFGAIWYNRVCNEIKAEAAEKTEETKLREGRQKSFEWLPHVREVRQKSFEGFPSAQSIMEDTIYAREVRQKSFEGFPSAQSIMEDTMYAQEVRQKSFEGFPSAQSIIEDTIYEKRRGSK